MKERPILFSAPMVRAILAGNKTQTRRIVKPQPPAGHSFAGFTTHSTHTADEGKAVWGAGDVTALLRDLHRARCPHGKPGDRLYVKEAAWMWCERRPNGKTKTGRDKWHFVPLREAPIHYVAGHPQKPCTSVASPDTGNEWGWRLKIGRFVPAWASRIALEVTSARVERLQKISEEDAIAEGCSLECMTPTGNDSGSAIHGPSGYCALWESINGSGSWDANPWVWVVEFKGIK